MMPTLGYMAALLGYSGVRAARPNGGSALICRDDEDTFNAEAACPQTGAFAARLECARREAWAATVPIGAQVDSRLVRPGNLFFCIKGARVDGHDFALAAAEAGASAVIAERDPFAPFASGRMNIENAPEQAADDAAGDSLGDVSARPLPPVFVVADTVRAMQCIAACHRAAASARVIGITGTAGKTSVKEVLARVLAERGKVERNPLNLNNGIGLPLSLLNADPTALYWVMEIGISEPGDMRELASILRPDMGLVLNVGEAHMEGLGDKGAAYYKTRLFLYIQDGGTALYCADYPELERTVSILRPELEERGMTLLRFSAGRETAFCSARYIHMDENGRGVYEVRIDDAQNTVHTPFQGDFGSENTAAVWAVAAALGMDGDEIAQGFSTASLPAQRFHRFSRGPYTVVDDSYNANPLSSSRMIEAASLMAREKGEPLLLIMGEMLELGEGSAAAHYRLGECMAAASPVFVLWKGGQGDAVRRGLEAGGYTGVFSLFTTEADVAALTAEHAPEGGVILFKGSRGNRLERLVAAFSDS